jgi:hypothetical protein
VDGVTVDSGDLVLLWQQTTVSQNGVYRVVNPGPWEKVSSGLEGTLAFSREEGTLFNRLWWFLDSDGTTWRGMASFLQD